MIEDVRSVIGAYVNEEAQPPADLRRAVELKDEAAQIMRQRAGGWGGHGGQQLRERVMRVADLCAGGGGDIAQIGHGGGYVTSGLAAVAQKRNCRVVAVDTGASEEERRNFAQATLPWRDAKLRQSEEHILRVLPRGERETAILLKDVFHWCFAFVGDKDNSFRAYFRDIMIFTSCPVVAVDYCLCLDGPRLAFEVGAVLLGRMPVRDARCREGYLVTP